MESLQGLAFDSTENGSSRIVEESSSEIVDIVLTEDAAKLKTVVKNALGLKIRVTSIDDLIAMKSKSKRPQDIEDIHALEKLRYKVKALQNFSDEYLEQSKRLSTDETIEFLKSFRELQAAPGASKAISVKIPESLLKAFRNKCALHDVKYLTQHKH